MCPDIDDLKEEFKELPNETDSGKKVALAGRLMSKRVMGKALEQARRDVLAPEPTWASMAETLSVDMLVELAESQMRHGRT